MYKALYINAKGQIAFLETIVKTKDSVIQDFKEKEALEFSRNMIRKSQIANYEQQLKLRDKSLTRQKRKTFIVAALGTLVSGAVTYLAITN